MRTTNLKWNARLVNKGDKVKTIERKETSSYSYIIDPVVPCPAASPPVTALNRIRNCKDIRENSRDSM